MTSLQSAVCRAVGLVADGEAVAQTRRDDVAGRDLERILAVGGAIAGAFVIEIDRQPLHPVAQRLEGERGEAALAAVVLTVVMAMAPARVGPPWISIEYPPSPFDATTRDAFLLGFLGTISSDMSRVWHRQVNARCHPTGPALS